ncbi:methionine aminopeptidase 2 [Aspergillus brasiliensis]|uniref:Methionine aminopeptidase n=1 Tax=Aspergillus brasiliensis TaxID=319629 RepID=A0A9W6DTL4_9EURO|nr:methionine aminopeptidase 2 [Aspergillus brasiliensis]GKZ51069.1 methionine aminopeptidase 2 [Aspergillus brasiliensis]
MAPVVDYNKIPLKTPEEVAKLRKAGWICARILEDISPHVQPGVTKSQLNDKLHDLIVNKYEAEVDREDLTGYDSSSFASVSFSHNDIAFNGEASDEPLKRGDVFGIDVSIKKDGWCGDTSRQWIIGDDTSAQSRLLVAVAYQAMCLGIKLVKPGAKVQDIAMTVQKYVESFGFSMLKVDSGTGHSIGRVHADGWHLPFYHDPRNEGRVLTEGMVITIEPFLCAGKGDGIRLDNVTKTAATADKSIACYWEHVVAITKDGCEILDLREGEDTTFYGSVPEV